MIIMYKKCFTVVFYFRCFFITPFCIHFCHFIQTFPGHQLLQLCSCFTGKTIKCCFIDKHYFRGFRNRKNQLFSVNFSFFNKFRNKHFEFFF